MYGIIDYPFWWMIVDFASSAGGAFILGMGAMYAVHRRQLARLRSGPAPAAGADQLERRVALLEEELAASRALVEQLSEGRAFQRELSRTRDDG